MKLSTWVKVAAIVVLGVCSSLVTSSILAQNKKSQPGRQNSKGRGVLEQFTNVRADPAQAKNPSAAAIAVAEQHLVQSADFKGMDVEAKDGGIAISAKVTLQDKRPNWSYVWTLSVRDASDNEVVGVNYDKQVFSMPSREPETVTFNETVPVKPGSYTVELKLWHARPDADLTSMRAVRDLRLHPDIAVGDSRRIVIDE